MHGTKIMKPPVVVFGAGGLADLFFRLDYLDVGDAVVVDNDPATWGGSFHGFPVASPDSIRGRPVGTILVLATRYTEIMAQLLSMGAPPGAIDVDEAAFLLAYRNRMGAPRGLIGAAGGDDFPFSDPDRFLHSRWHMERWSPARALPFVREVENWHRYEFIILAFHYMMCSGVRGDYHEFGSYTATTMRMCLTEAYRRGFADMEFHAFDSFEGMPADSDAPGSLATSERDFWRAIHRHGVLVDRVHAVQGFYDRTLTPALRQRYLDSGRRVAFANVDCDLYESTVPVLDFLEPLLADGAILYFDDYFTHRGSPDLGERRAFREFQERADLRFTPYRTVGAWGQSFLVHRPAG